eukprot:jgi/Mesvir1/19323/Mv25209-RA.1
MTLSGKKGGTPDLHVGCCNTCPRWSCKASCAHVAASFFSRQVHPLHPPRVCKGIQMPLRTFVRVSVATTM